MPYNSKLTNHPIQSLVAKLTVYKSATSSSALFQIDRAKTPGKATGWTIISNGKEFLHLKLWPELAKKYNTQDAYVLASEIKLQAPLPTAQSTGTTALSKEQVLAHVKEINKTDAQIHDQLILATLKLKKAKENGANIDKLALTHAALVKSLSTRQEYFKTNTAFKTFEGLNAASRKMRTMYEKAIGIGALPVVPIVIGVSAIIVTAIIAQVILTFRASAKKDFQISSDLAEAAELLNRKYQDKRGDKMLQDIQTQYDDAYASGKASKGLLGDLPDKALLGFGLLIVFTYIKQNGTT